MSFESLKYLSHFIEGISSQKSKFSNHAVFEPWTIELFQVISKRVSFSNFEFSSKLWKRGTLKHFKSFHRRIRFVKGLRFLGMLFELWIFEVYNKTSYMERIANFSTFYSKLIKLQIWNGSSYHIIRISSRKEWIFKQAIWTLIVSILSIFSKTNTVRITAEIFQL